MTIRRGKESIEQRAMRAMRDVFPGSLGGVTPVADPFAPKVVPGGASPAAASSFQVAVLAAASAAVEAQAWGEFTTVAGPGTASGTVQVNPQTRITGAMPTDPASPSITYNPSTGYFTINANGIYAAWCYVDVKGLATMVGGASTPRLTLTMVSDGAVWNAMGQQPYVDMYPPVGYTSASPILAVPATFYPAGSDLHFRLNVNGAGTTTWNTDGRFVVITRVA